MPITPVPENPPVTLARNQIDWTEQLDAVVARPGEWFKVDGPLKTSQAFGRVTSIESFAAKRGHTIETNCPKTGDGNRWLYARLVAEKKSAPQVDWKTAAAKAKAKATAKAAQADRPAPNPPLSPIHDDGTHPHQCEHCGDTFRTNTRLRQHQANAHKAS